MSNCIDEFVIAIDPGVKYVGVASGWQDCCYASQLNLEPSLSTVYSIVEQHWDIIEWIYYYHFLDKRSDSRCTINVEITKSHKSDDGAYGKIFVEVCNELEKRLQNWQSKSEISYVSYTGLETLYKRRELRLNKTIYKSHRNIMAHINDARALWALGFGNRYSEWSGACKLEEEPAYIDYLDWSANIINDYLDPFKKRTLDLYETLSLHQSKNVIEPRLLELCTSRNSYKVGILEHFEAIIAEIPDKNQPLVRRLQGFPQDWETKREYKAQIELERLETERKKNEQEVRQRQEAKKKEKEKEKEQAELRRLDAERKKKKQVEQQRLEAEKKEKEQAERQRLEAERKNKEQAERQRLEAKRKEKEQAERQELEAKKKEKEQAELRWLARKSHPIFEKGSCLRHNDCANNKLGRKRQEPYENTVY